VAGDDEEHAVGEGVGTCLGVGGQVLGELGEQVVGRCGAALVEQLTEVRL
jgi:hypothetical protein